MIKAIGMVIISIVIVVGGMVFMFLKPDDSGLISPMVGTVVAYYFLSANQNRAIKKTVNEVMTGDPLASSSQLRTIPR